MRVLTAALLVLAACRHAEGPTVPIEKYEPKAGQTQALSASGKTAVLLAAEPGAVRAWGQPDDLLLVERATGKTLGKAHGFLVGQPGDAEAYALVDHWLLAFTDNNRRAELTLPPIDPRFSWVLKWATIDYATGTALIVFHVDFALHYLEQTDADRDHFDSRYELVEVDLRTMKQRSQATMSMLGSYMAADDVAKAIANAETRGGTEQRVYGNAARACDFASVPGGSSIYLTCRVPELNNEKVEHWVATRWDGHAIVWSTPLDLPPALGGGDVASSLSGDGKTLVIAHGDLSYGVLEGDTTILLDAATGTRTRMINRGPWKPGDLGSIAELIPLPGEAAVVQIHVFEPAAHYGGSRAFHGFSRVDATNGAITTLLDTSTARRDLRDAIPGPVLILPTGTFLLAY